MAANKALVEPQLLVWARDRAKVTLEEAAKAVHVSMERLTAWESGEDAPTVAQLRLLAAKYHFPLAVFYLPEPPLDFDPLRDFRRLPDFTDRAISANLPFHIRNAQERRELALELTENLRDGAPISFPLHATLNDNPETVGQAIRDFLGVTNDGQTQAASRQRIFDFWRRKMEERDVLVFVAGGPHYGVGLEEMRGFAIATPMLPVVVINGKTAVKAAELLL